MTSNPTNVPPTQGSIHVRPYEPGDHEFVLALAPRLVIGMAPWRDRDKMQTTMRGFVIESMEQSSAAHDSKSIVFIAGDERGERLGFVSVAHGANFTGEVQAYIGELVVSAQAENRGVGRALVQAAEEWARAHGYTIIVLDTGAANEHARLLLAHRLSGRERATREIALKRGYFSPLDAHKLLA